MSGNLKVYFDLMSQPARAVVLFLKANKVPFTSCPVALRRLEHMSEEYKKDVHPFGKVPAIDHNGFKLFESIAILRYLCREVPGIPDHWYPKDSRKQAKVDEYLEWQHLNTRTYLSLYFLNKVIVPLQTQRPPSAETIEKRIREMEKTLGEIEEWWLADGKPFLTGDTITIADLFGVCECEQPAMAGYNPFEKFPKIGAWRERIRHELNPHYDEVHAVAKKFGETFNSGKFPFGKL